MAAFPVGIIDQEIEGNYRTQPLQVALTEIKIMILRVMLYKHLQRARTERSVLPECCWWDKVPSQSLADKICSHLPVSETGCREVP